MSKKNKNRRNETTPTFAPLTVGCLKCEDQGPHDGEHVFPAAPEAPVTAPVVEEATPTPSFPIEDLTAQPAVDPVATPAPVAAPVATTPTAAPSKKTGKSTIEKPTRAVWTIADEMKKADPNVTRKQIVDECMRRGIAYYTARTQAQLWSKKQAGNS